VTGGKVNSPQPQVKSSHRQVHTCVRVPGMLTGTFAVDFDYGQGIRGAGRGERAL